MFWFKVIRRDKYNESMREHADLVDKNLNLQAQLNKAKAELSKLRDAAEGKRVCGGYCKYCEYGLEVQDLTPFQGYIVRYVCSLDVPCKDFDAV